MNKDLKYMPIDNRASSLNNNGTPFRNNAIKKMESIPLFNHVDGHPKPVSKENPFGPAPEGFGDSRTGSFRKEVTPTKRSLESLKNEFETKMSRRQQQTSQPGPDRLTQFQAQKDADAFTRLSRTDPKQFKRISSIAKDYNMSGPDIRTMINLQESRTKRLNRGRGSVKQ
jgi:hypothetical protein